MAQGKDISCHKSINKKNYSPCLGETAVHGLCIFLHGNDFADPNQVLSATSPILAILRAIL